MKGFPPRGAKGITVHGLVASLAMIITAVVIHNQVSNRATFANVELYQDVMDRWGTPITQPSPTVRFVPTGTVFTDLSALPLAAQQIAVNAAMNYRKRGLVYFSGFDLRFEGRYEVENTQPTDIDIVFIFPIQMQKNRVLLSDVTFTVDGTPATIDLAETSDKLVWTGRLPKGKRIALAITYAGRGLDSFVYHLDPSLPVRDFTMATTFSGGDNFDYPEGVVPATASTRTETGATRLTWEYASLESGVPVGLILPSEKAFDEIIATMARRSFIPFVLFMVCLALVLFRAGRPLHLHETGLMSAVHAFFYVLLAYLAAFMDFYTAYVLSALVIVGLTAVYVARITTRRIGTATAGLMAAALIVPTTAVILQGYTGLIYTLEILAALVALMWLSAAGHVGGLVSAIFPRSTKETTHDALA
ncbi:MAG: hypothetical protein GF331_21280 [Chitinivibrionales bacterium]|nr:hypothetical protein [Chitinivibrionales bacterium]